jgi:hypothetical protein
MSLPSSPHRPAPPLNNDRLHADVLGMSSQKRGVCIGSGGRAARRSRLIDEIGLQIGQCPICQARFPLRDGTPIPPHQPRLRSTSVSV